MKSVIMSKAQVFFVEVVELTGPRTQRVVKRLGPMSERKAERVDNGLCINLNHEMSFTRIVPEGPDELGVLVS